MFAENDIFGAVLVDTNAFDAKGDDFFGIFDAILPSFFTAIRLQNIQLLSHPVLMGEVLRHINSGDLKNKPEHAVSALIRNKPYLELIGIPVDEAIQKLKEYDFCAKTIDAYQGYYKKAVCLPYANPDEVFRKYFENEPPFSEKNDKKAEFPDAFVIGALEEYLDNNPNIRVLVVTNDNDWIAALDGKPNARLVGTIDSALQQLNNAEKRITECVEMVYSDIATYIHDYATRDVWFEMENYECQEELEIEAIRLVGFNESDIVPLSLFDNRIVLQVALELRVDGSATVVDYDKSVWDSEDRCYIFTSFGIIDFSDASGQVIAEIQIDFEKSQKPILDSIRLVAPHGVLIAVDENKAKFTDMSFDATDAQGEISDALEEYYRH